MCNGGGLPALTAAELFAVLGLAVVTSPIWVPGLVLYGTYAAGEAAVQTAGREVTYRRTTHVLKKIQKRILRRVKAGEWQAYLQLLFERTREEPNMANLHELGVAMLLASDTLKAERLLSAALEAPKAGEGRGQAIMREVSIRFARGIVYQELGDYTSAAEDFETALNCLSNAVAVDAEPLKNVLSRPLPKLTRSECLNSWGYATFLKALYEVMQADDYMVGSESLLRSKSSVQRISEARSLLEEATEHFDAAIKATEGDPQGMFYFNRGKAKYFRALLSSMHTGEADFVAANALTLDYDEQALVSEALADFCVAVGAENFGTTAEGHAMRAQALAVLGRQPEAFQAAKAANDLDPKVFLIDLSSATQLSMPWPLPQPPHHDAPHDFVDGAFHRPHYCDHCLKLITNFRNAYRCARCQFRVHRGCLDKAKKVKTCWKEKRPAGVSLVENFSQGNEVEAPSYHVHVLAAVYFHIPTWCDECSGFCFRPHGYRCTECRYRIHEGCLDTVKCVVAGSDSLAETAGGNNPGLDTGLEEWLGMKLPKHAGAEREEIQIVARTLAGYEVSATVLTTDSVRLLKDKILRAMGSGLPASRLGLQLDGAALRSAADHLSVAAVGLESGSVVSVVVLTEDKAVDSDSISAKELLKMQTSGFLA